MSYVTNLLLTASLAEDDDSAARDATLAALGFARVDRHAGGTKSMECDVWAAALNHVNLDELIAALKAIPWDEPHSVQLFVRDQHDERFAADALGLAPLDAVDARPTPDHDAELLEEIYTLESDVRFLVMCVRAFGLGAGADVPGAVDAERMAQVVKRYPFGEPTRRG